jgi:ferredoxin
MCKTIVPVKPDRANAPCRSGGNCARCHLRLDEERLRTGCAPSRGSATKTSRPVLPAAEITRAMTAEDVAAPRRQAPQTKVA